MDCNRVRELFSDYLEEGLADGERAAVAAHLGACARCAAEAKGLAETIALLAALPREKAPPELLDRLMSGIERETAGQAGRRRLFTAGRIRIPLEAAAAVLLLALVYGVQREMPARSGPPAGEGGAPRATATAVPDASPPVAARPRLARDAAKERSIVARGAEAPRPAEDKASVAAPTGATEPAPLPAAAAESRAAAVLPAGPETESRGAEAEAGRETAAPHAAPARPAPKVLPASQLPPAVTAARVSSAAETIEPKAFAAPPSRMLKALPFGREVTLEVASADRAGIEERIVAAAQRLGGGAHPGAASDADAPQPFLPASVRVHVPAVSAVAFLDALKELGTIPPEGMPASVDLPAGPAPGVAAYTVRIRVR